jgi:CTP:molybdopterin cytidylyltransferase MocA
MGTPKALLQYQGETFLDRLIGIFEGAGSHVIVVLGGDGKAIRAGAIRPAHFVINAEWDLGQLSSLQCGLSVLPDATDAVFFMPVDCPAIHPATPRELLDCFGSGADFVIPRFQGRRGHPVLFDARLIAEFLGLPPDSSAREVVHRHLTTTRYVDVDDPGVLRDIDEPADYEALTGASRQ